MVELCDPAAATFSMGSTVEWTSQAGSFTTTKCGTIVLVIPAGTDPLTQWKRHLAAGRDVLASAIDARTHNLDSAGQPRDHESYLVFVAPPAGVGRGQLYWPRARALRHPDGTISTIASEVIAHRGAKTPPKVAIEAAIYASTRSGCRSQRGAAIWQNGRAAAIAIGFNALPIGRCDQSLACKSTCARRAVHAEQAALIELQRSPDRARSTPVNLSILHVKSVAGALVASGPPSCIECAKLILASGIPAVWLYRDGAESGAYWQMYRADEFYRQSLAYHNLAATDVENDA